MKIVDVFDAIAHGTYNEFIEKIDGDINQINSHTKLNLLQTTAINDNNSADKLKIAEYLLAHNIDINYTGGKHSKNALHILYSNFNILNSRHLLAMSKLLVENGININQEDAFGATPMQYLIAVNKISTLELKDLFIYLLENGANYSVKDNYGKNCLDYAKEFSWRNELIAIVKEFENGNK
ncbi:ankyrin repeat domain-containing protein [Listeria weihenstephanensis]|uniref:Ankyrin repeat domain-containing protein n=1 Tax=Listeria weihenstephanensis TaxID=1006155 RepID=A0A841Z994_9LIST|nr:ankyrin repeat domain-containing protein [Listeria weihenstephanensis]MBC1501885.1 ankyrin repeat domain-containing protein [Listeria weihenstephanensis]